jgi:hypothetical protein
MHEVVLQREHEWRREEDVLFYVLTCGHEQKGLETYACETSGTQKSRALPLLLVLLADHVKMPTLCNNALTWHPMYFLCPKTWM